MVLFIFILQRCVQKKLLMPTNYCEDQELKPFYYETHSADPQEEVQPV